TSSDVTGEPVSQVRFGSRRNSYVNPSGETVHEAASDGTGLRAPSRPTRGRKIISSTSTLGSSVLVVGSRLTGSPTRWRSRVVFGADAGGRLQATVASTTSAATERERRFMGGFRQNSIPL